MALALILIVLAILLGGIGLLAKGLLWLLIIAALLFVIGAAVGFMGRAGRSTA